ncbi:gluconate 2-dehydrogenase subunit 3 family protein [Paenibacillus frigoriresistens]|uniref:gluconate 2-dehydrogenase subunit 3 family protein n=1 Tax=Paenibacillus alginolyticus TaxID=59839 RepID=UPI0015634E46|nr:gluconate 2-dehydrogenase subunit 3 family protein [Paenibacillus frigoriresistens]NRF95906.1 gluconate 2-dehydrogenase subunit 3 family protein [Paenibacillus frigoriresistens]
MTMCSEDVKSLMFLNEDEAGTIEAITARLIPGDPSSPGAREAGAVIYIDRSLAGYYSFLQTFYRQGIDELNHLSKSMYKTSFAHLSESQQDELLHEIERSLTDEVPSRMSQFFAVVYEHTLEGTFGDPLYGGNRNTVGWKLIGFPGAQWGYTADQMKLGYDVEQINVLTLSDVRKKENQWAVNGVKK